MKRGVFGAKIKRRRVLAVIAILGVTAILAVAAVVTPIFLQTSEQAKQAHCESNCRRFMVGILQYSQDNDQNMPLAFAENDSYGPATARYNTQGLGDGAGRTTGIPSEIFICVKDRNVFLCPDDHAMTVHDIARDSVPATIPSPETTLLGLTFQQVYGTSYKFTHESESDPFSTTAKTGFATSVPCRRGSIGYATRPGAAGECDLIASGEKVQRISGQWTPNPHDTGKGLPKVIALGFFARPSETRIFADWQKSFADQPFEPAKGEPFHPDGTTVAYVDGHVRFVTSRNVFASGCDGVDWAWDTAGTCNVEGLQRNRD